MLSVRCVDASLCVCCYACGARLFVLCCGLCCLVFVFVVAHVLVYDLVCV